MALFWPCAKQGREERKAFVDKVKYSNCSIPRQPQKIPLESWTLLPRNAMANKQMLNCHFMKAYSIPGQ